MRREHFCQRCGHRWIENETDAGACPSCGSWDVRVEECAPESADHASICAACEEPLTGEVIDGECPRCAELRGRAEDWQERTGAGRW